jgi:hypothetical protein
MLTPLYHQINASQDDKFACTCGIAVMNISTNYHLHRYALPVSCQAILTVAVLASITALTGPQNNATTICSSEGFADNSAAVPKASTPRHK